ncbi:MAG: DUF3857 domain-containing protein [Calditrichaeota bacterium]|jgi:hypothetical protein|nr:DUF3857 domain-containing protein [Calditrichota bacterium]MBT7617939.1 DUF3857 domain-containing protein [Calditrichota bacterium]MBT7790284.1 DUF3857 domain-containing protein [Calditrichota bacterium]
MKSLTRWQQKLFRMLLFGWVLICFCGILSPIEISAQTSYDGEIDITVLMQQASESFDLEQEDAIILYDNEEQLWLTDKKKYRKVHRIVWIGKSWGIGHFADHRIPIDYENEIINVKTLRTYRDEKWWDSDTTAIVETLPGALRTAYDYATIREMMLLHDGVELPCILEWAYSIEDKDSFRRGVDGIWIFEKDVPVIKSSFSFGIPTKSKPYVFVSKEVGEEQIRAKVSPPALSGSKSKIPNSKSKFQAATELDIYTYEMEMIPALPTPHTADPAANSPHIEWSTWKNWDKLGKNFRKTFESAMVLDSVLRDSLELLIEDAFSMNDRVKRIASFVSRSTRYVNYPSIYWYTDPRPAHRSYSTAYAHQIDRAVLAAALFKEAGFEIFPTFRGLGYHDINNNVATFDRFGEVGVWVSGSEEVEALYNPAESMLQNGLAPIYGRSIWIPGSGDDPKVTWRGEANRSKVELTLNINCSEDGNTVSGNGFYSATQGLCPFAEMEGLGGETLDFLESVMSGVLDNAKISTYSPTSFSRFTVTIGFEFTASFQEESASVWNEPNGEAKRLILNIGEPGGGIFDHLPGDIAIFNEVRNSDIRLPGLMEQVVKVNLIFGDKELSYIPENVEIKNDMGSFRLEVERKEKQVKIKRTLTLEKVDCHADRWIDLRTLLLSDRNERNRAIVLR